MLQKVGTLFTKPINKLIENNLLDEIFISHSYQFSIQSWL